MNKEITLMLPDELCDTIKKEAEEHHLSFEEFVLSKLNQVEWSYVNNFFKNIPEGKSLNDFLKKEYMESKKHIEEINMSSKVQDNQNSMKRTFLKDYLKIGTYYYVTGIREFAKWSDFMIRDVGKEVKPYLENIWNGINKYFTINDAKIRDWIDKNKDRLNIKLQKIEGDIIETHTGKEFAARYISKRKKSIIQYNENTQGKSWYHLLSYSIYNILEKTLSENDKTDIKILIGESDKKLNEQFANAFVKIFTNPNAPQTKIKDIIKRKFEVPESYELIKRTTKELETIDFINTKQEETDITNKDKKIFVARITKALSIDLFKIFLIILLTVFLYLYYQNSKIGRFQFSMDGRILDTKTGETYDDHYKDGKFYYESRTSPIIK